ncbi:MAG TPA: CHAT domain-containing protein, partial [Pyrinomonadaceae bacterium]
GVPLELRAIIRDERDPQEKDGVIPGIRLLDTDFTDASFAEKLKPEKTGKVFNLIHLATHFRIGNTSADSGLLLGNGELLSLSSISKKSDFNFKNIDLLTLSACETGVSIGESRGGEIESLGLLVQRKGAKAVLATLWKVADASTAMLMSEFYRLRRENPTWTKSKAMQAAQLAMISGKLNPPTEGCANRAEIAGGNKQQAFAEDKCRQFAHPFYWSPFVLIGNWR